jgi:hypothetical protein
MAGVHEESSASDPTLEEGCRGFPQDRAGCGHAGSAFNLQELPGSVLVACSEGER